MNRTLKNNWADKLGIIGAILCIIHCLSMPLLLTLGLGGLENPVIATLFVIVACVSVYNATDGTFTVLRYNLLWISLLGFILCIFLEEKDVIFKYGMYLFSTTIIVGHLYNLLKKNKSTDV